MFSKTAYFMGFQGGEILKVKNFGEENEAQVLAWANRRPLACFSLGTVIITSQGKGKFENKLTSILASTHPLQFAHALRMLIEYFDYYLDGKKMDCDSMAAELEQEWGLKDLPQINQTILDKGFIN